MICPDCGAEYQDHVKLCADCHVLLARNDEQEKMEATRPHPDNKDLDLVHLVSVHDLGQVGLVKSLLDESNIPAMVRNDQLQDLFGIGRITFNPVAGEVEFWVRQEDVKAALSALEGLELENPS